MTRIFGYELLNDIPLPERLGLRDRLIDRVESAIRYTYERKEPWQASRLGILISDSARLLIERNLIGYQSVRGGLLDNITYDARDILMEKLPPSTVVVCVMNEPDYGPEHFRSEYPIFSGPDPEGFDEMYYVEPFDGVPAGGGKWAKLQHRWTVFTMGSWYHGLDAQSEKPYLEGAPKPSFSLLNYLRGIPNYQAPDFSWINPARNPFVLAFNKSWGTVHHFDRYSDTNQDGNRYVIEKSRDFTEYCGVQDISGNIV